MVRQSATSSRIDTASTQRSKIDLRFRELSAMERRSQRAPRMTPTRGIRAGNSFGAFLEDDSESGDAEWDAEDESEHRRRRRYSYLVGVDTMFRDIESPESAPVEQSIPAELAAEGFVAVPKREKKKRREKSDGAEERRVTYQQPQQRNNWSSDEDDEWMENVFAGYFTRSLGVRSRRGI